MVVSSYYGTISDRTVDGVVHSDLKSNERGSDDVEEEG